MLPWNKCTNNKLVLAIIWWNWNFVTHFNTIGFALCTFALIFQWKKNSLHPNQREMKLQLLYKWLSNTQLFRHLILLDFFSSFFCKTLLLDFCYCLLSHKNVGDIQLLPTCCIKLWLKTYIKYLTFEFIGSQFFFSFSFFRSLHLPFSQKKTYRLRLYLQWVETMTRFDVKSM